MFKELGRQPFVLNLLGRVFADYIRLVDATTRWRREPADLAAALDGQFPVIISLWHGQHVFAPIGWPKDRPISVLVARHKDGEVNAIAVEKLGLSTIRGAGGPGSEAKMLRRGGMQALRRMIRTLKEGSSVAITADVPKIGGVVGEGIVLLAKLSGRPIYPLAVVTGRGIEFNSWDRATVSLPLGRGAIVLGEPVTVAADADADALEAARRDVGLKLNQAHARAYELAGGKRWQDRLG